MLYNTRIGAGVSTHGGLSSGGGREPVRKPVQNGARESGTVPVARREPTCPAIFVSLTSTYRELITAECTSALTAFRMEVMR